MIKELKFKLFICIFFVITLRLFAADTVRIESEYKLDVPQKISKNIWPFLIKIFGPQSKYLNNSQLKLSSKVSEEKFKDVYFDNKNLFLLKNKHGLRLRKRFFPHKKNHPSNGKTLLQLKLSNVDNNLIARSEIKFKANNIINEKSFSGQHDLMKYFSKTEKKKFVNLLNLLNLDAYKFHTSIFLNQVRKRIYIYNKLVPFITITFDSVITSLNTVIASYFEIELELNEVLYTNASVKERIKMKEVNDELKDILFNSFPELKQDQTPKYNKAVNRLSIVNKNITNIIKNNISSRNYDPIRKLVNIFVFMIILLLLSYFLYKKTK